VLQADPGRQALRRSGAGALGHLSKRNSAQLLRAAVATLSMSSARARLPDREAGAALPRLSAALPGTRQMSCRCPAAVQFPPSSSALSNQVPAHSFSPLTCCRGKGGKLGIAGVPDESELFSVKKKASKGEQKVQNI
jgi:hypothetical protein